MPKNGVTAVVLAAGLGNRYRTLTGRCKLLEPLSPAPDAPCVLQAVLSTLDGVAERLLVVVRDDDPTLTDQIAAWAPAAQVLPIRTAGLGESLAQAAAATPAARGWLVMLGDMPFVSRATCQRVARALAPQALVVPAHQGRLGHPRGIGANFRNVLLALDGDRGAQALFRQHPITSLQVDDPGILLDIDTPQDLPGRPRPKGSAAV